MCIKGLFGENRTEEIERINYYYCIENEIGHYDKYAKILYWIESRIGNALVFYLQSESIILVPLQ